MQSGIPRTHAGFTLIELVVVLVLIGLLMAFTPLALDAVVAERELEKEASQYGITIELVSKQLGVAKDKINRDSSFVNDLGADSLDTVELVMEIEEAFDLSIPDEAAEKIQTVGDAIKYIEQNVGG